MASIPAHAIHRAVNSLMAQVQTGTGNLNEAIQGESLPPSPVLFTSIGSFERNSLNASKAKVLTDEIGHLQLVLTEFQNNVYGRIASLHRQQNLLSPIYRLPPEVLVEVFRYVQSMDPRHYPAIARLVEVSSRWHSTCLSTPSFWSHLSSVDSLDRTRCLLKRSKYAPLHITLSPCEPENERNFMEVAIEQSSRWRTFTGDSYNTAGLINTYAKDKVFPLLEKFHVYRGRHISSEAVELPGALLRAAPRLCDAVLTEFFFPAAPRFSRLRRIHFKPIVGDRSMTVEEWNTLLHSSPELEILSVDGPDNPTTHSSSSSILNVHMGQLSSLKLFRLSAGLICHLITGIFISPDNCPTVSILHPLNEIHSYSTMFPEYAPPTSILVAIRSLDRIALSCNNDGSQMIVIAGSGLNEVVFSFESRAMLSPPSDMFRTFVPSAGLPLLKRITVEGWPLFRNGFFQSCLPFFPSLEHLVIHEPDVSQSADPLYGFCLENICSTLRSPVISEEGAIASWQCPNLKYLEISQWHSFDPVLQLIQSRYGTQSNIQTSMAPDRPASLVELRLQALANETTLPKLDKQLILQLKAVLDIHDTNICILPNDKNDTTFSGMEAYHEE